MKYPTILAMTAVLALPAAAWGHGEATHPGKPAPQALSTEEHAFGREGDPKKAARTVKMEMSDAMRYAPSEIRVQRGETIRFEVTNAGKVTHEIVIGTMRDLKEHAEMMKKHPGMEHDEPRMAHVAPGKTGRLVWQFTRPGEFYYACLIPGHFEAGMIGKIIVR